MKKEPGKKSRWRIREFQKNNKCYYCQKEMILFPFGSETGPDEVPDNAASIEHLHENGSKERRSGNAAKVLACFRCNQNRSNRVKATTIFTIQCFGFLLSLKKIGDKIGLDKI